MDPRLPFVAAASIPLNVYRSVTVSLLGGLHQAQSHLGSRCPLSSPRPVGPPCCSGRYRFPWTPLLWGPWALRPRPQFAPESLKCPNPSSQGWDSQYIWVWFRNLFCLRSWVLSLLAPGCCIHCFPFPVVVKEWIHIQFSPNCLTPVNRLCVSERSSFMTVEINGVAGGDFMKSSWMLGAFRNAPMLAVNTRVGASLGLLYLGCCLCWLGSTTL